MPRVAAPRVWFEFVGVVGEHAWRNREVDTAGSEGNLGSCVGRGRHPYRIGTGHNHAVDRAPINQPKHIVMVETDADLVIRKPDLHNPYLSISTS